MLKLSRREFLGLAGSVPLLTLAGCGTGSGSSAQDGTAADGSEAPQGGSDQATSSGAPASGGTAPEGFSKGADARVVALSKSVGELWTLAGGTLAGVTDDGLELAGAEGATSVGTISKPNQEQIVALEPDVVMLTPDIPAHVELKPTLEGLGIATYVATVESFEDYQAIMADLTAATGRDDLWQQNVADVAEAVDDVRARAKEAAAKSGVAGVVAGDGASYLALRVSASKNKVLKSDYFACEILDDMQLTNVADDSSALDDLSIEAIVAADPTWVFVVPQGQNDEAMAAFKESFEDKPAWPELTAVKEGRVVTLPKDLFQYKPNARWGEAYEHAYEVVFD